MKRDYYLAMLIGVLHRWLCYLSIKADQWTPVLPIMPDLAADGLPQGSGAGTLMEIIPLWLLINPVIIVPPLCVHLLISAREIS